MSSVGVRIMTGRSFSFPRLSSTLAHTIRPRWRSGRGVGTGYLRFVLKGLTVSSYQRCGGRRVFASCLSLAADGPAFSSFRIALLRLDLDLVTAAMSLIISRF